MAQKKVKLLIDQPRERHLLLRAVGISPLLCSRFPPEIGIEILRGQTGGGGKLKKKPPRKPDKEYIDSLYKYSRRGKIRYGFPSGGIKNSAVSTARTLDKSVKQTFLRQAFFVDCEHPEGYLPIISKSGPKKQMDMVKPSMGNGRVPVLRGRFQDWEIPFTVVFDERVISPAQIVSVFATAGSSVGIGAWRPERGGRFGRFIVKSARRK